MKFMNLPSNLDSRESSSQEQNTGVKFKNFHEKKLENLILPKNFHFIAPRRKFVHEKDPNPVSMFGGRQTFNYTFFPKLSTIVKYDLSPCHVWHRLLIECAFGMHQIKEIAKALYFHTRLLRWRAIRALDFKLIAVLSAHIGLNLVKQCGFCLIRSKLIVWYLFEMYNCIILCTSLLKAPWKTVQYAGFQPQS